MYTQLSQKNRARQTCGANLKTAKEESGVKRRARVGEPSNKGMVNDFPLILGEREQGTKAKIAYKPKCACCCDVIKYYQSAISCAANNTWVCCRRGWSSGRFEFTIEELVERPINDESISRKLRNFSATYL